MVRPQRTLNGIEVEERENGFRHGEPGTCQKVSSPPIPDEDIRPPLRSVSATAHRQLVKGPQRVINGMVLRFP